MPASEARISANRANALHSTGPKTDEGKRASRRNALKHGLTGDGVALPTEDVAAVGRRLEVLQDEFDPATEMGAVLVQRVALLSVRLERSARQESAAIAAKVLRAEDDYDEARRGAADHLLHWIGASPATNHRRLLATPEGIDRLIVEWRELKAVIDYPGEVRWDYANYMKADFLTGRDCGYVTAYQAYCFALKGDCKFLKPEEVAGMDDAARRRHAGRRIAGLIEAEIAGLLAHRATLDHATIAAERAGAAARALFDPSKEAILARKYEAATERAMYRAIKELRQVERDHAEGASPSPSPAPSPSPSPDPDEAPEPAGPPDALASFFRDDLGRAPIVSSARSTPDRAATWATDEVPIAIGRPGGAPR